MGNDAIWDKNSYSSQNVKVLLGEEEMKKSPALPFLDYPQQLEGWVGGEKGFDPLGISYILPIYYMRECELKHGRVCMLATLGWIATDLGVRFPGEMFQGVSSIQAHDKMVALGLMQPCSGRMARRVTSSAMQATSSWASVSSPRTRIRPGRCS